MNVSYLSGKTVLVTGGAGFIGYHFAQKLLNETQSKIVIVDNMNDYYAIKLKRDRLRQLGIDTGSAKGRKTDRITFYRIDLTDLNGLSEVFKENAIDIVVHLAAQAGVRYAKENPRTYIDSNIEGFFNVLQQAAEKHVDLCLYASSSSVYGNDVPAPFKESAGNLRPLSLYAATKLSSELIAQTYSQSSGLHCVGMRFFNVYGPWGRPDMAYYAWANALKNNLPVTIHGEGRMWRDMTYIDDVTKSMFKLIEHYGPIRSAISPNSIYKSHEIFNIGNSSPVVIQKVFDYLNARFGPIATEMIQQSPKGDDEADKTCADTTKLMSTIGFCPQTDVEYGLEAFCKWFELYQWSSAYPSAYNVSIA